MAARYELSLEAQNDLLEIWHRIAEESVDLANRIEDDFRALFASLSRMPHRGHIREDLSKKPLRFIPLHSFLIVYQPDTRPIRIIAVLRGKRDIRRILRDRV